MIQFSNELKPPPFFFLGGVVIFESGTLSHGVEHVSWTNLIIQKVWSSFGSILENRYFSWIERFVEIFIRMTCRNSCEFVLFCTCSSFFLTHFLYWVVVSNIFYFHPYLGMISNLTNIFQLGWNHQLVYILTKNWDVLVDKHGLNNHQLDIRSFLAGEIS